MLPIQTNTAAVNPCSSQAAPALRGNELETMVAGSLLGDLNTQLAAIASQMQAQLEAKQSLRSDIAILAALQGRTPVANSAGILEIELSGAESDWLGVRASAMPVAGEGGAITGYSLPEAEFQTAVKAVREQRQQRLAGLNDDSELTMIQVQSLVDQRKNALTLLSNLIAASNDIAKTIIGNVRG